MRRGASPPRAGVTLLELMICVAVLAVLGALALPGLGSRLAHQRLQHAAETLSSDITEARYLAAQGGRAVHLQALGGAQWCWSVALRPGCDCSKAEGCQIRNVDASKLAGVRLLDSMALRLDPGGFAEGRSGATFESANGDRLRVEVSAQGRPRICASSGNWPRLPAC